MSNRTIYEALRAAGMTAEGACGLMGNMGAESGMKANIAQRGMTSLSDDAYTAAADSGTIDFAHDSVGYGLCQWTYWSRKAKLLAYAKMQGCSVGDEAMQVRFCIVEMMNDFPQVWAVLTSSTDLASCTELVLNVYENPAVKNYDPRYQYAREFLDEFGVAAVDGDHIGDDTDMVPGTQPEISGALAMLAGYLQTREFQTNFLGFIERSTKK